MLKKSRPQGASVRREAQSSSECKTATTGGSAVFIGLLPLESSTDRQIGVRVSRSEVNL